MYRCCFASQRVAAILTKCRRQFASLEDIKLMRMPSLSPTMTQGTISSWKKEVGDNLLPGDVLCEVETDKASVGFEVQDEGVLAKKITTSNTEEIVVGTPIAFVVDDRETFDWFLKQDPNVYSSLLSTSQIANETGKAESSNSLLQEKIRPISRMSPAARHISESKSLDVSSLVGSARNGKIITKGDVMLALRNGISIPTTEQHTKQYSSTITEFTPSSIISTNDNHFKSSIDFSIDVSPINQCYKDISNSNIRKVIAKRLTESKATVPHTFISMECDIDEVLKLRKILKSQFDVNASVNDIVIKSAAMALRDVPEISSRWNKITSNIEASNSIDISVAVATPNGLITPIITDAEKRGIANINQTVKDLATRAKDGKLKPEEYQGGVFSISNLGMFGIDSFSAVINPPQACILAVGAGVQKVVPPTVGTLNGKPRIVTKMTVQLSADRRVIDEAIAAEYLSVFSRYLSNPQFLLL